MPQRRQGREKDPFFVRGGAAAPGGGGSAFKRLPPRGKRPAGREGGNAAGKHRRKAGLYGRTAQKTTVEKAAAKRSLERAAALRFCMGAMRRRGRMEGSLQTAHKQEHRKRGTSKAIPDGMGGKCTKKL